MPINTIDLHTFTCSVPDCKSEITKAGKLGIVQRGLIAAGWSFNDLTFGGNEYDLCPSHDREIRIYFGIDHYPNNTFPNETGHIKVDQ